MSWKNRLIALFCCTLCSGCYLLAPPIARDGSVDSDLAVMNAKIFTSNTAQPWAEAVAVKDQRIVYVGDGDGLKDFLGPNTRIVNARGTGGGWNGSTGSTFSWGGTTGGARGPNGSKGRFTRCS